MMLIGLDTNIILRAILNDNKIQSSSARELLSDLNEELLGYISVPVIMELFWVLRTRYKIPKSRLLVTIRGLLATRFLQFERFDAVVKALAGLDENGADFSDALIAEINLEDGCSHTATFDEDAAGRITSMELLT